MRQRVLPELKETAQCLVQALKKKKRNVRLLGGGLNRARGLKNTKLKTNVHVCHWS